MGQGCGEIRTLKFNDAMCQKTVARLLLEHRMCFLVFDSSNLIFF